jgi:hypothetical protein
MVTTPGAPPKCGRERASAVGSGLITGVSGYIAVHLLNDAVDYRADRKRIQEGGLRKGEF